MELVSIIEKGGPMAIAAVMAMLYWMERTERREAQKERNLLLERCLSVMSETKEAIKDFHQIIRGHNG